MPKHGIGGIRRARISIHPDGKSTQELLEPDLSKGIQLDPREVRRVAGIINAAADPVNSARQRFKKQRPSGKFRSSKACPHRYQVIQSLPNGSTVLMCTNCGSVSYTGAGPRVVGQNR